MMSLAFAHSSAARAFGKHPVASIVSLAFRHFALGSRESKSSVQAGHLYFVATPIGNLAEMSQRAVDVLSDVDVIVAEDTRHTLNLLRHFKIDLKNRRLLSHHEHNKQHSVPGLVSLLLQGQSMAIVSDAGTPGISDPGAELAAACAKEDIPLHPVGASSACIAAVSVSGYRGPFTFFGFLSVKKGRNSERMLQLQQVQDTSHMVVLYEAPHRLVQTLSELAALSAGAGASRGIVIARELSKMYEEIKHTTVGAALQWAMEADASDEPESRLRGEFCLVLAPIPTHVMGAPAEGSVGVGAGADAGHQTSEADLILIQLEKLRDDGMARSQAVQLVCDMRGVRRPAVYKLALTVPW